ncbi:hypothetical protein FQZ97_694370 [compost metagenome]
MAKIVDGLAQEVTAIGLIDGDLRHREVGLGELFSCGVHPDENLGDCLNVEVFGQLDDSHMVVDDAAQLLDDAEDLVL